MCFAVKCNNCNKTTWAGCGMHVDSVKKSVPPEEWCECSFWSRKRDSGCGCVVQ